MIRYSAGGLLLLLAGCEPALVAFPGTGGDTAPYTDDDTGEADADTDADSDADSDTDTDSDTDADTDADSDADTDADTDTDCPTVYADADGDGYGNPDRSRTTCDALDGWVSDDTDCDDTDAAVYPGAPERGDGVDQDCDNVADDLAAESESGWTILGDSAGDAIGGSLFGGDVDGDGVADVLVAAADRSAGALGLFSSDDAGLDLPFSSGRLVTGVTSGDRFGAAFAVLDDLDGDGAVDVVAGAPEARGDEAGAGAVYLFDYGGAVGTVSSIDRVTLRGEDAGGGYGTALGVGDIDSDGVTDLVVGAPGAEYYLGTTRMYLGGGWIEGETDSGEGWMVVGEQVDDALGSAVAVGDVDGDGYDDVITCASGSERGGVGSGACWLLEGGSELDGEETVADQAVATFEGDAGDTVGLAGTVTLAALDGDSALDVVLGAPGHDGGDGAVAVWWGGRFSGTLALSGADTFVTGVGGFGSSVSGATGPVGRAVLTGAPDNAAGDAYLLDPGVSGSVPDIERASWGGAVAGDGLGAAAFGGEDLDDDGVSDFVLAAPGSDDGAAGAGKVYVLPGFE